MMSQIFDAWVATAEKAANRAYGIIAIFLGGRSIFDLLLEELSRKNENLDEINDSPCAGSC